MLTSTDEDSFTLHHRTSPFSYVTVSLPGDNIVEYKASLTVLKSAAAAPPVAPHTSPSSVIMRSPTLRVRSTTPSMPGRMLVMSRGAGGPTKPVTLVRLRVEDECNVTALAPESAGVNVTDVIMR